MRSPWLRTLLSSVFVLFMLASAHLLMVVVNAVEVRVAAPTPAHGLVARLYTDVAVAEELEAARDKARTPEAERILDAALADVRAGRPFEARTLPVTPFLVYAALGLSLLGLVLLFATSRVNTDAGQTILGIFAGNLIWTGAVEYGLTIAARTFGIGKTFAVVDGQVAAMYGEYVLLKHTWGPLVLVLAYLVFVESSRCPLFLWWRQHVRFMRGPVASGRIDNYGPRSAFQYGSTVWAFYLLLLWAYDETVFGVHGIFTNLVLFASLAGSVYCVWRLHQHHGWGPAIRYAVGAMIVVWTPIEIFGKWGVLHQPWIILQSSSVLIFFGGLGLGTWALWRAQRHRLASTRAEPA
ncbi:MAG: hypothetical protein MUE41_14990 [Gemmatimonadaceae bacterium]|jgi:hypothetical protein|nr:hypothetical protein [Gemmatimonadaceae bacterium]